MGDELFGNRHEVSSARAVGVVIVTAMAALLVVLISAVIAPAAARAECGLPTVEGDTLEGSNCADFIVVPKGIDEVVAGAGNDIIIANPEVEEIYAGAGDDQVYGDDPPPALEARAKRLLRGPSGYADLVCDPGQENHHCLGVGDQTVFYQDGDQIVFGQDGNDTIWGGRGNDQLDGGDGVDRLFGSVGDDYVAGGAGDDRLAGGNGSDNVLGEEGNDYIHGDTVGDVRDYPDRDGEGGLQGGEGIDTISFATAVTPGFDQNLSPFTNASGEFEPLATVFPGFPGPENRGVYIDLAGLMDGDPDSVSPTADNGKNKFGGGKDDLGGFEWVVGSPYTDVIIGNDSNNLIWGGGGADVIYGGGGQDWLFGGQDGDYLIGGPASDTGSSNPDALIGGEPTPDPSSPFDHDQCAVGTTAHPIYADVSAQCESTATLPRKIEPPDPTKINVGLMQSSNPDLYSQTGMSAYVTGTANGEDIMARYTENGTIPHPYPSLVVFTITSAGDSFNTTTAEPNGCSATATVAVCELGNTSGYNVTPTITMNGGAGDDLLDTRYDMLMGESANFPKTATKVMLGGAGEDTLWGDNSVQDILIDGPDADKLYGQGSTDVLYSTEGADEIDGGEDGDVLYVTRTCQNKQLNGGDGEDNVTWAAWSPESFTGLPKMSMTQGIVAELDNDEDSDIAGQAAELPGNGGSICTLGSTAADDLFRVENLEGTGGEDRLIGNNQPNTLLGRGGADELYGKDGKDYLRAHSNDYDDVLSCGDGGNDVVGPDLLRGDARDSSATSYGTCEFEAGIPAYPYKGYYSEYDSLLDVDVVAQQKPLGLFRLGERFGSVAYEGTSIGLPAARGSDAGKWQYAAKYIDTGSEPTAIRAIAYSDDTAHNLDGNGDYIEFEKPSSNWTLPYSPLRFDPGNFADSGFTFETWAKFGAAPGGTLADGYAEYLFFDQSAAGNNSNSVGFFRHLNGSGNPVIQVKIKRGGTATDLAVPFAFNTAWHHYAFTLKNSASGTTGVIKIYIDGDLAATKNASSSVFPPSSSGTATTIGKGPANSQDLHGWVDNAAFFGRELGYCSIARHAEIGKTSPDLNNACP